MGESARERKNEARTLKETQKRDRNSSFNCDLVTEYVCSSFLHQSCFLPRQASSFSSCFTIIRERLSAYTQERGRAQEIYQCLHDVLFSWGPFKKYKSVYFLVIIYQNSGAKWARKRSDFGYKRRWRWRRWCW